MQFLGVCLIMFSIFLLKLPDLLGASDSSINALPVTALYLAIIASGISGQLLDINNDQEVILYVRVIKLRHDFLCLFSHIRQSLCRRVFRSVV